MNDLSHFDEQGASRMVDVGDKPVTARMASAQGCVRMQPETLQRVRQSSGCEQRNPATDEGSPPGSRGLRKGNVLEVARLAGIMATKRTDELIPLCHSIPLDSARIDFEFPDDRSVLIRSTVCCHGQTGVEMEALTAVSVAALTIYDMCKAIDRGMEIGQIYLLEKKGGKSGHYRRPLSDQTATVDETT